MCKLVNLNTDPIFMKKDNYFPWRKALFIFGLITLLFLGNSFSIKAQSISGATISWDTEVGCQTYRTETDPDLLLEIFLDDIGPSNCIQVCEYSKVSYTFNYPPGYVGYWTGFNQSGGLFSNLNATSFDIDWGAAGTGFISFRQTINNVEVYKTVCVEIIESPTSLFDTAPFGQTQPIKICANQQVDFTNLSTANNGSSLVGYHWNFDDGTTSTAFEPSHTFTSPGFYSVSLEVKNECNCTDITKIIFEVEKKGIEISCPTVVCEGQSAIYSIPSNIDCGGNYNWTVTGGQILSQTGNQVEVLWDNIGPSGFGYITFDPSPCDVNCGQLVTSKVPVVQTNGTIQGPTALCLGEQGRYKLPQWPTTEIDWEIIGVVGSGIVDIYQSDQRNEVVITPHIAGTYTLRATYTNTLLKCSGEAEFTFTVEEQLSIIGDDITCSDGTLNFTTSQAIPVDWTFSDYTMWTPTTTYNSVDFNQSFPSNTYYIPRTYTLTASQTGYCDSEPKIITVLPKPDEPEISDIIGDLFVCPNSTYSYQIQNPDPNLNYIWEIDPMYGAINGTDVGDQINIDFNGVFPAEIEVYAQSISPLECESDPFTIIVNEIEVVADISNTQTVICGNSLAAYNAFEFGTSVLHTYGDEYIWSFANASPSGVIAASLGSVTSGQGTNSIDVTWNNVAVATTLDLILEIKKCNTTTQFVKEITLNPTTEIDLVGLPDPVCGGSPVVFTVQSINGNLSPSDEVTWNFYNGPPVTTPPGQFTNTASFINNTTADIGQPVSAFIGNGSCGQSNTANVIITVTPNPPAIITLTSGSNSHCNIGDINTTLTVSSNTTNLSNYQWLKNNAPIPLATGNSLNVLPGGNTGPGSYTFTATNTTTGCVTESNAIDIFVTPCGGGNGTGGCGTTETITNTSSLTSCGQISFSGNFSGSINTEDWYVGAGGPSPSDYTITPGVGLTGVPGKYRIVYVVTYDCPSGTGTGTIKSTEEVIIPYEPEFSYVVECVGSNTFNVNFIDNSIFYATVSLQDVRFYYKLVNGSYTQTPYNSSLNIFEIPNLPAGNYVFKQEIEGYLIGNQGICSKEVTVNLQGLNPNLAIEVNQNQQINCHYDAVGFNLSPQLFPSTTVFWDFNDDGAQNSLTPTERVFNTPNSIYNVTCEVTNDLGCSVILNEPVAIPEECFFGDIVSSPSPAEVCQNQTVDLTYVPFNDVCTTGVSYQWMNENTPIGSPQSSNTLTVSTTGFYWVKVISANGCEYSSPTQIKPFFKTLPNVKLIGETTICEDAEMKYKISTNSSIIRWFVDNTLYSQFNDLLEANFTGLLTSGNYTVSVEVDGVNGCTNTTTLNINVVAPVDDISFNVSYDCTPYNVIIEAIPNPSNPNITYNWSNGASTQTISVPDGGPYRAMTTLGGCKLTKEIDIPRNPENYLWIFPDGCYSDCIKEGGKDEENSYLVGPTLPLTYWGWNESNHPVQSGTNSFAAPYYLNADGLYSFTLNTGYCEEESKQLDYSLINCDECEIENVDIAQITQNNTSYCSFTVDLSIFSASSTPFQVTISDNFNNVAILPSSFTLNPGGNNLQFTVIPQNNFSGGITVFTIQGSVLVDGVYVECIFEFQVDLPSCSADDNANRSRIVQTGDSNSQNKEEVISLYPNPANDMITIQYDLATSNAVLEIFEISGRSISKNNLTSNKDKISLDISKFQPGVYIVVVRQNNGRTWQQKIIIE